MRKLLSRFGARWAVGLVITLMAVFVSLGFFSPKLVESLEIFIYDMRFRVTPPTLDRRIVIVDIDEKSLNEIGRWPWSRNVISKLVDRLADDYKVSAIGFDIWFSEPDTSSGYAILEELVNKELKDLPGVRQRVTGLRSKLDFDGRLAKSFQHRPVVLGYFLSEHQKKGILPQPAFSEKDLNGYRLDAYSQVGYEANLGILQNAARGGGFVNTTEIDADGVLRSTPLLMKVGDDYYEALSLATVRVALGAKGIKPVFLQDAILSERELREYGALDSVMLDTEPFPKRVKVERFLTNRVQYRGTGGPNGGAFRYIAAADIIQGKIPPAELTGSIVLVGTTAPGLFDLRATPVNPQYPGVEVHANVIRSILDGEFKEKPDYDIAVNFLQLLLLGIVLVIALSVLGPVSSILISAGAMVGLVAFNFWLYQAHNLVLPVAAALLLIFTLFIVNIAWGYLFEYRKGRAIVNLFGEYVAPELVAVMAEDPASYNMDGESRELTVLFSDVRGFTTISESLEPNALREYINLYLTAMSEDIRGNRGTLDKYIGDAVMAFWGAPVALPDHASRAVATALSMQATAKRLNQEFIARGWPPLKIGIGLNTGEMRVGDMGSKVRRAYTVMGDAVNLAARLEGITKTYGAGVVVGPATMRAAPQFVYRELDRVRVKGKNEPVAIYEPLCRTEELTEELRDEIDRWHQALAAVRAQDWEAAQQGVQQLHQQHPEQELYLLYLRTIAHYRAHPPAADWDGVTTFTTK